MKPSVIFPMFLVLILSSSGMVISQVKDPLSLHDAPVVKRLFQLWIPYDSESPVAESYAERILKDAMVKTRTDAVHAAFPVPGSAMESPVCGGLFELDVEMESFGVTGDLIWIVRLRSGGNMNGPSRFRSERWVNARSSAVKVIYGKLSESEQRALKINSQSTADSADHNSLTWPAERP